MTGEIVNLKKFRKDKTRAEKDRLAGLNRAKFGLSKAEKRTAKSDNDKIVRSLDGARLTSEKDDA